jgi:hypothetical protein
MAFVCVPTSTCFNTLSSDLLHKARASSQFPRTRDDVGEKYGLKRV